MKSSALRSRSGSVAAIVLVLFCTSGCVAETRGARLADAKSIAQLVRNEAEARIPLESIDEVIAIADTSYQCLTPAGEADGTKRRWMASSRVTLVQGAGDTLQPTFVELINSFSADGWSEVSYGGGGSVTLQKPYSSDSIAFLVEPEDAAAGVAASITVSVSSGCVDTGGRGSSEVAILEGAAS